MQKAKSPGHLTSVKITQFHNSLPAGFHWDNIQVFTVLTGLNGIGKSQLILAILQGFENLLLRQHFPIEIAFRNNEIPHVCALSSATSNVRNNLVDDSAKKYEEHLDNISRDFAKCILDKVNPQQYKLLFPEYDNLYQEFHASNSFPTPGQNNYQYELESKFKKFLQSKLGVHSSVLGNLEKLATCLLTDFNFTITDINIYLEKYNFKYRLDPRTIEKAAPTPRMSFTNPEPNQTQIDYGWLSPGEILKLHTILWIIYSEKMHKQHKPSLLLLDEPDAHLEPGLSKEYFDVLMNFVIGQLGFQVIMTTHRPTSLCLLPLEVIHTLERRDDGTLLVRPNKTRREAIETLTSGFVNVNDKFRIVFVEADDDANFYTAIQDQLIRANLLPKLYQVVYKSFGKKRSDDKGDDSSCDAVQRLVISMTLSTHDSSLINFIFGIIDNDSKDEQRDAEENSPNLLVPERYAIENYLLDPINLFYYLKKIRCSALKFADIVTKVGPTPETLSQILRLDNHTRQQLLQQIIDVISSIIEEKIKSIFSVDVQSISQQDKNLKSSLDILLQKERFLNLNIANLFTRVKIQYIENISLTIPFIWTKLRGKNLKHLLVCALDIEKGPKLQMSSIISSLTQNDGMILIPYELFEIILQLQENISQNALEKIHKPIERKEHEKLKSTASGLQAENKALKARLAKKDPTSDSSEKSTASI